MKTALCYAGCGDSPWPSWKRWNPGTLQTVLCVFSIKHCTFTTPVFPPSWFVGSTAICKLLIFQFLYIIIPQQHRTSRQHNKQKQISSIRVFPTNLDAVCLRGK